MQMMRVPMDELVTLLKLQMDSGVMGKLTVVGTSMQPLFKSDRDNVYLQYPEAPPRKGDIILYKRENGQYVLHRIVAADKAAYTCCGDNQWQKERVHPEQILAVVTGFVRNGKEYTLQERGYKVYVAFWVATRPLRRPAYALLRVLSKCKRKLFH